VSRPAALAKTEIQWWHALTAVLGERVQRDRAKFKPRRNDYEVKAVYKGSYPDTLNRPSAAYRAKQPPHIVQVYEVGTQTMLSSGAVYPVYQLVKDHGVIHRLEHVIGPVKSYTRRAHLYSMAFNSSTPVLFYNRSSSRRRTARQGRRRRGTRSRPPPRSSSLRRQVGFSAAWPSWTLMENMHAIHDQPFRRPRQRLRRPRDDAEDQRLLRP